MTAHDLITIGITCYNAQDTIARAIKSACAQEWPHTEIIVVDDASTDGSVSVVEACQAGQSDIKLIKLSVNGGPAMARQTLVEHAVGTFIAFFDDDDESLPGRLRTQHARITAYEREEGATLVACYASGRRKYPSGYTMDMTAIGSYPDVPHGRKVADRLLFFGQAPGFFFGAGTPTCALMARTETIKTVGGFDPAFRRVEDVDFAIRLALAGGHFIGCPQSLFIQYSTGGTDKAPEKNRDAEIQLAEKYKDYLKSVKRYGYAKTWPLLRYYHFKKDYFKMILTLAKLTLRYPVKTVSHFLTTAPRRFMHERKMKGKPS